MRLNHRPLQIILSFGLAIGLVVGCGVSPFDQATPTRPDTQPTPTGSPAASAFAPSSPLAPAPSAVPSPAFEGFVMPASPGAATVWTGVDWRRLGPDDPLAHVRSVTRWAGGFVAVGDPGAAPDKARTPVWTSADGATWTALDPNVFGPRGIVVGMAASGDGLVALTQRNGPEPCYDYPDDATTVVNCWIVSGPTQSWTSSDGTTWAAHPGPGLGDLGTLEVSFWAHAHLLLGGVGAHVLAVDLGRGRLALSADGTAWETIHPTFPAKWRPAAMVATASGLLTIGNTPTKTLALSSTDGRVWTRREIQPRSPGIERIAGGLVTGSAGVIATGNEYQVPAEDGVTVSTRTPWVWWSTLDERTWDTLPGYPPLGPMRGREAQECRDACPAGVLVGDGERMLAYRVFGKVGAWTSFDGRSWQHLAFTGTTPTGQPGVSDVSSVFLMPMGILVHDLDGATWFGAPTA